MRTRWSRDKSTKIQHGLNLLLVPQERLARFSVRAAFQISKCNSGIDSERGSRDLICTSARRRGTQYKLESPGERGSKKEYNDVKKERRDREDRRAVLKIRVADPPWQVKKPLIATLDSIAMLSAGAFPSQPHWCRRPSPHECPPPGFLGNASFTLMSTLARAENLFQLGGPAARQTYESRFASLLSVSFSPSPLLFSFLALSLVRSLSHFFLDARRFPVRGKRRTNAPLQHRRIEPGERRRPRGSRLTLKPLTRSAFPGKARGQRVARLRPLEIERGSQSRLHCVNIAIQAAPRDHGE